MPRCIHITPADFATLSADKKEAVQRQQAQCLFDLANNGSELTQSETEYVKRILGRVPASISNVPSATPSGAANVSAQFDALGGLAKEGLNQISVKLILPLIILAGLVFATVFLLKRN